MKYLITGGCGFMGSNMIRYLLAAYPDLEVINLDKLTYAGNPENLKDIEDDKRYTFVKGDIADEKAVNAIVEKGIDVIINFAAESHVDRSILGPKEFLMTDIIGTYTLLEAAKTHNVPKYIQISTDEVFGSVEEGEFSEESPFEPNSPYSASKAGGDHMCRAYYRTFDTPVIVTHSCNFIGPYQYPEKMVPLFITNLMENKKVPLYGDGMNIREWIYVDDYCRALDTILQKGKIGEIYNIGTSERKTNKDITESILKAFGKGDEMVEYVKDRPGHDRRYAINWGKLKKLGWKPDFTFEESLAKTIDWYKNNEAWWKPLKSGEYLKYYKQQYGKV